MRRFDYVMHISPTDTKQPRRTREGTIRTDAKTIRDVAAALAGENQAIIPEQPNQPLADDVAENRFEFDYSTPELGSVHVEMHQVAEGVVHPLTKEGVVAWAERQVRDNPEVNGKPNTVNQELAAALHKVQMERLYDYKASELRCLLSDLLLDGHRGYMQMTREDLLAEIERDVLPQFEPEDRMTVEDIFCVNCEM